MLKQGKTWHRGNQKGSVLLTVVIMVMVLFTLTSICLDVIHHSTRVSSRNVQKTQAKLTAERVLTEFIDGYIEAKEKEYAGDASKEKNLFADLMNDYAVGHNDEAHATKIDVSMKGPSGPQSDFDAVFGHTYLQIYMTGSSSFVVESICTYSTQTQTASVVFETKTKINKIVSHTVESQSGKLIGDSQLTNGIDGSIYIEKTDKDVGYKKMSRTSDLKAHIYSEFSLRFDDGYTITDMRNTSHGNNAFTAPKGDFDQAPTLICDGYLTFYNNKNSIGTKVGKMDANKRYPGDKDYDASNLGNYDGFVKVDKKLILTKGDSMTFGQTDTTAKDYKENQIDIYTHGIIIGGVPYGEIEGEHNFDNEAIEIRGEFPKRDPSKGINNDSLWTVQTNSETKIHGNVYAYKGYDAKGKMIASQDGSIVLMSKSNLTVDGDVFCEGNIYLVDGDGGHPVITCNNLYCMGKIIVGSKGSCSDDERGYKIESTTTYDVSDGKIPSALKDYFDIKSKKIITDIPKEVVRNQFPESGYDPQTGFVQSDKLADLYAGCSANDMFTITVTDGTESTKSKVYKDAAKEISSKYADAMMRSFVIDAAGDGDPTKHVVKSSSKYDDPDEGVKAVVETGPLGTYPNDAPNECKGQKYCYYYVNASMKFTKEQLQHHTGDFQNIHHVGYVIKLKKDDIVIALPVGTEIGAKFRIDRTERDKKGYESFVYFMYYDPNKMSGMDVYDASTGKKGDTLGTKYTSGDACLYYDNSTGHVNKLVTSKNFIDDAGNKGSKEYNITPDGRDAASDITKNPSNGAIWMGANNVVTTGVLVGDIKSVDPSTDVTNDASLAANFAHNTFDKQDGNSVIMYMIPNDVGFTFIKAGVSDTSGKGYTDWNGNGARSWRAQGLIYGIGSNIKLGVFENSADGHQNGLFGQVKGYSVNFLGDNKDYHLDCGMAEGSLLDYVGVKNNVGGSVASVKLMYYQY